MDEEDAIKLSQINKSILEIKKKIQLSEGQRRALFEDCEAERKSNADEIFKLKKEVSKLVVVLHECQSSEAKYRLQNSRIEDVIGPLTEKTCTQVKELLDLSIIDQSKKRDLLKYKINKRRKLIEQLGVEYQNLLSKKDKIDLDKKVDKPVNKSARELQNEIHTVEVQVREATHIRNKYSDIRKSLKDDAGKFEFKIKSLEEELQVQKGDITKLQKIMEEATKRKAKARGNLLKEEKLALALANQREKEASEGRRLVSERKVELEKLEKRLFLSGKMPVRPEPEGAETEGEEDKSSSSPHPVENRAQEFELLKRATGGTSTQEVLRRFEGQKETQKRLNELRSKSENEKRALEKKIEVLKMKLDGYKYSESREAEKKSAEMDKIQSEIGKQQAISEQCKKEKATKEQAIANILRNLNGLRLLANPLCLPENDTLLDAVKDIEAVFKKYQRSRVLRKSEEEEEEELPIETAIEDSNLPTPYNGLIRRAAQPQTLGAPTPGPPPGSEEEDEVPSRSFLKRQAQLVIDAKSRRRNLRIHLPKRN